MNKKNIKKVVLAYSGGLDTSIIIPWLKENYNNCEVIAVSGDVGQGTELDGLEEKALKTGASKLYIEDLKKEFVEDYIFPTMKAGAVYEDDYLLGTSFARPVIAKRIAEIALAEGADAICHGCTGKGNDQVRFELTIMAFAPQMQIIAPWREWSIKSRDEEIDYAEAHNIPLKINRETNYSKDKNLWHLSHEGLDLEDPANEPLYNKDGFLEMGVSPEKAPDKPTYVTIHFEKGIPNAIDGKAVGAVECIEKLNKLGGENGIGLADLVENRLVGMKSRGVYETPGGTILYRAHQVLETICLDRDTQHYKAQIAQKFAELVYYGQWFTPLREACQAFVESLDEKVTGEVKMKLYKGNIIKAGTTSPYSLYNENLASFTTGNAYVAGLPRMLYGLARDGSIPAVFGKIHPKYRFPMAGVWFTVFLIALTTVYITAMGGTSDVINLFINTACVTWLVTYIIAMVDVLVLRKKYPDFPRLWKAPIAWVTLPIGMLGALYAISTLSYVIPYALIVMAVVAVYCIVWNKSHKKPINEVTKLEDAVIMIRERTEYLPVWDEAVVDWLKSRNAL